MIIITAIIWKKNSKNITTNVWDNKTATTTTTTTQEQQQQQQQICYNYKQVNVQTKSNWVNTNKTQQISVTTL